MVITTNTRTITLGADPEFFLEYQGKIRPVVGKLGGTKTNPIPVGVWGIQEDNVAAEFNIPPTTAPIGFSSAIKGGIEVVLRRVKEKTTMTYQPSLKASHHFDDADLTTDQAKTFGCEPDMNAWTMFENSFEGKGNTDLRTCGGHIHVGGIEDMDVYAVVRAMDLFLGVPSVLLDVDTERRSLYGNAGAFRRKPYGVEYRVLSNFWIFSKRYCDWVWKATNMAIKYAEDVTIDPNAEVGILIQDTINKSDINGYSKLKQIFPGIAVAIL